MACAGIAGADVIVFNDGAYDEGYVHSTGTLITVRGRDGKSEYSVASAIVARIEYNRWYNELDGNAKISAKGGSITTMNTQSFLVAKTGEKVTQQLHEQRMAWTWLKAFMKKDGPRITARGTAQAVKTLVVFVGLLLCMLVSTIASIVLIIDAFKRSVLWGLVCLFCGIGLFVYIFTDYEGERRRMLLCLTAPLWWLLLAMGLQQVMQLLI